MLDTSTNPPPDVSLAVAPLDPYATRITMGVAYLGGLLMLPILFAYLSNMRWNGLLIPVAIALPIALFLLLCYAVQPRDYRFEGDTFVIKRRWWRALRIPLNEISAASAASQLADLQQRGVRFGFNIGVFGYQGPFRLAPYGEAFFMATNSLRLIALARPGKPPLIISPERPRAFIEAFNERRAQQALRTLRDEPSKEAA